MDGRYTDLFLSQSDEAECLVARSSGCAPLHKMSEISVSHRRKSHWNLFLNTILDKDRRWCATLAIMNSQCLCNQPLCNSRGFNKQLCGFFCCCFLPWVTLTNQQFITTNTEEMTLITLLGYSGDWKPSICKLNFVVQCEYMLHFSCRILCPYCSTMNTFCKNCIN